MSDDFRWAGALTSGHLIQDAAASVANGNGVFASTLALIPTIQSTPFAGFKTISSTSLLSWIGIFVSIGAKPDRRGQVASGHTRQTRAGQGQQTNG